MMSYDKFIILFLEDRLEEKDMIIDFFKGLLGNGIGIKINNNSISFFYFDQKIDINEIAISMNTDMYIPFKIFEASKIDKRIDIYAYNDVILECEKAIINTNLSYITESDLIRLNICSNELLKQNILKKYYNDRDMLAAIKTFLECNLNISKAANLLFMHRNTLMNKIDKFIEVTGYDIKNFKDAFVIYHLI